MSTPSSEPMGPAIAQLSRLAELAPEATSILRGQQDVRRLPRGADLSAEGRPAFIASGYAARTLVRPGGRRHVAAVLVPGDGWSLGARRRPLDLCPLIALTPVEFIATPELAAAREWLPQLSEALSMAQMLEEGRLLRQIARLAWRSAEGRLCDLFLELRERAVLSGLAEASEFPMPLTQANLGEITALSIVHVNRILQQLRADGVIDLRQGWMTVLKPEDLAQRAGAAGRDPHFP